MESSNIEPELSSLESKLEIEIANDEKEVEFRKKRIEKHVALLRAIRGSLGVIHPETADYGSKSGTIREAIRQIHNSQFTQKELQDEIIKINPKMEVNKVRIRSALWTMSEKGEIRVARKGTNKEPALYEKINADKSNRMSEPSKTQLLRGINPPRNTILSVQELERAVREKHGRVNDLAERLGTTPTQIMSLLEPASKVYVGFAGWLKLRE